MLVALKNPEISDEGTQRVDLYLPNDNYKVAWYDFFSKSLAYSGKKELKMSEIALYVKSGSIVPVLLHKKELALLRCIWSPVELQIYLDDTGNAYGDLVLDDGLTVDSEASV